MYLILCLQNLWYNKKKKNSNKFRYYNVHAGHLILLFCVIHAQWKYLHKCLEGQNSKPTSYTEYLRAMRDYKRRRQSYRAKNVHITRKSYTEVTRLISRFVWFVECSLQETYKFWTQERQKVTIGNFRQITH